LPGKQENAVTESLANISEHLQQIGEIAGEIFDEGDVIFVMLRCLQDYIEQRKQDGIKNANAAT